MANINDNEKEKLKCPKCGKGQMRGASFCNRCGATLKERSNVGTIAMLGGETTLEQRSNVPETPPAEKKNNEEPKPKRQFDQIL